MSKKQVENVYAAKSPEEQEAAYDEWAAEYERDLFAMGYRPPAYVATCFAAYVPITTAPILDAGCGAGAQAEPLAALGYGPITGIDLSEGMMSVARSKGIYAELRQQTLGEALDFPTNHFGAILSSGTITPGHAPAKSFDELLRVLRPGGRIVFTMRCDDGLTRKYSSKLDDLTSEGSWTHLFSTPPHQPMPYGHPEVWGKVHIYEAS